MRLLIESTDQLTTLDGVPCRVWEGTTEGGVPCKVFIHRLAVHKDADASQFALELAEQLPPGRNVSWQQVLQGG